MKKKIISLCLVLALALTAIGGATLAYFTDKDQVENTFTIGNISIDLYEKTDAYEGQIFQNNLDYSDIMPGDYLSKEPYIENDGDYEAYVRVAIVMNNLTPIQNAIDEVYENMKPAKTEEEIQAIYDNIFDGFGISHLKSETEVRRMWMDEADHPSTDGIDVLAIDMAGKLTLNLKDVENSGFYTHFSVTNMFQTETEKTRYFDGCLDDNSNDGYYSKALNSEERIYVFYLKMQPDTTYQLFDGLKVPEDFTAEQMAMFDDLKIGIYADAIQTANFETAEAAFEALEAAHPLGWWND